jgi:uncharacterized membrane protein
MTRLKAFIKRALIGGILVLLPLLILGAFFKWMFYFITDLIQPLTNHFIVNYQLPELVADLTVIAFILLVCFVIGTLVATSVGSFLHSHFDKYLAKLAPGYRLVKEIVTQVLGDSESSPFSRGEVVTVKLFGEAVNVTVTALVTAKHQDGRVTIFMPTGPNPTSGNIYHVAENLVTYHPEVSVEKMMKSIIACGAGSNELF